MKKKILFFMPSFEGGGVEKNLILVANFFAKKPIELKLSSCPSAPFMCTHGKRLLWKALPPQKIPIGCV